MTIANGIIKNMIFPQVGFMNVQNFFIYQNYTLLQNPEQDKSETYANRLLPEQGFLRQAQGKSPCIQKNKNTVAQGN
ncbi:MAG: hypothetical protein COU10_01670 [Candidatus Harrisonbacteria bacterium CG10_big_fil_rev_8_21_14_0_10_45_28]|uniref:Uncharacterized protein n=1 Tax=Candidatus Harrisonbacteria bacterium CG10_big_fil_rev_8_21_14_0_10_45_28 TaxID=1974586 RepID=A0A2H0UNL8_9BACT|nr:MAG: hypothetical protein COU10_01670 [Candidatus Harrisonbacteria bacterium CG10_big_fil_rev_8_21_14_0_10_45_28]